MSPRAAWRLETLGFKQVYDYAPGKMDWIASGLPIVAPEKENKSTLDYINRDVPTCSLSENIDDVRERLKRKGFQYSVVITGAKVVLGLFRISGPKAGQRTVEEAMESGPTTFRAHTPIEEAAAYLAKHDAAEVLVTASDGKLLGVLHRDSSEQAVDETGPQK